MSQRIAYIPDIYEMLPQREFRCDTCCNKVFKNRAPYEKHMQRKHGIERQTTAYNSFKCPHKGCNFFGNRLELVRRHFQNNHMEKNYNCERCNRKFVMDLQVLKHRCQSEKYPCPRCPKAFRFLYMRNKHLKDCVIKVSPKVEADIKEQELIVDDNQHINVVDLDTTTTEHDSLKPKDDDFKNTENNQTVPHDMIENLDPNANVVIDNYSDSNANISFEEIEQLFQNIENKTIENPDLIQELAALTPILKSLQSDN